VKTTLDRLATFALAATVFLLLSSTLHAQKTRPNIDSLTSAQIEVLQAAMKAIKALPDSNPMSYGYLRDSHDGAVITCMHGSEAFMPWHRELLLRFERALQKSGVPGAEDIMLPYWDWSQLSPEGPRYPKIAEDSKSEFFHERNTTGDSDVLKSVMLGLRNAMREITWQRFGGRGLPVGGKAEFESTSHDLMHAGYIGGDMANGTSAAKDPIFWLFHTGIDYFWWQWQQQHPGEKPADLRLALDGFEKRTIADVMDTEKLGYTYPAAKGTPVMASAPLLGRPEAAAGGIAPKPIAIASAPMSASVDRDKPFESYSVEFTLPGPGFKRAELLFHGVELAGANSYLVRYYIHPKDMTYSADDEAFRKTYLAAIGAHFGGPAVAMHAHGHQPPTGDIRTDVSEVLSKLAENHAGETWMITAVYQGSTDLKTGKPRPLFFGEDVVQQSISLALDEE
jgi:Common central domain of tyrosinase